MNVQQHSERRITVFDTTLRDGEQSAGVCFSLRDKLDIAAALESLRVDVIEVGFPTSAASEARAVRAVAASLRNSVVCALSRAVEAEIEETWQALAPARRARLHIVLSCSDLHLERQLRKTRDEVLEMARRSIRHARRFTDDVEFSAMDATRADPVFLASLLRCAVAAGATTINVPDTLGCALPDQVHGMFVGLFREVPELGEVTVSFHGQNDLGLATANTLAAVSAGAGQVEVAVNGIGERAGNTSLEEVVMALRIHGTPMDVRTSVEPKGICALSRLVEERSGMALQAHKAIVGRNAFRHASGLHQDGWLKQRETYEVFPPEEIGHSAGSEIVLGKLSGRHGFAARARALGFDLGERALDGAFDRFKRLAEERPEISDAELEELLERKQARPAEAWPGPGV